MIDPSNIDSYPLQMVERLQKAGFTTYFVGGCVRDLLLGRTPKDFDIATSAKPNDIRIILERGRLIGKRFKLVLVRHEGGQYEIATFRSGEERFDQRGRRDFNIFGSPESDAKRRDFTINALFYDPFKDQVIDYVHGQEDLLRRLLRSIRDPRETYLEDPIRILRALRIAGKLGLNISRADYFEMVTHRELLATTSIDRVREEIYKALKEGTMRSFSQELLKSGAIEYVFPFVVNYSREELEDLVYYYNVFDTAKPFKDFEIGISIMWLPLFRRSLQEKKIDLSTIIDIEQNIALQEFLKNKLRYSAHVSEGIAKIFFFWVQIRQKWTLDGVPETQRPKLIREPYFYAALQLAKIEEKRLGDYTPTLQWIDKELSLCYYPQSIRQIGGGLRRGRPGPQGRNTRWRGPGRFSSSSSTNERGQSQDSTPENKTRRPRNTARKYYRKRGKAN